MTLETPPDAAWEALPDAAKTLLEETQRTLQERRCQPSMIDGKTEREAIMRDAAGRLGTVLNEAAATVEDAVDRVRKELTAAIEQKEEHLAKLFRSILGASLGASR